MGPQIRESAPLLMATAMLLTSNALWVTLLSLRAVELGFSEAAIGVMQAAYPAGALVGCLFAPRLVERIGHARSYGAIGSLLSAVALGHLASADFWTWTALRALAGCCFPALYVVAESWLNERTANANRGRMLSLYFVAQIAGAALGQSLLLLRVGDGELLFVLASALISLAIAPVLMATASGAAFERPGRMSPFALARRSPSAAATVMLNGVAQAVFYLGAPLYGLALGFDGGAAAALVTVGLLATLVTQFPLGWISDRIDRRLAILGASVVGAAAALAGGVAPPGPWLYLAMAVVAGATLPLYGLAAAHANDLLRPAEVAPAAGALVLMLNIGLVVGALVGPAAIGWAGAEAFFWVLAAAQIATAVTAALRARARAAPSETGTAQALSAQSTQIAAQLHPDGAPPTDRQGRR